MENVELYLDDFNCCERWLALKTPQWIRADRGLCFQEANYKLIKAISQDYTVFHTQKTLPSKNSS